MRRILCTLGTLGRLQSYSGGDGCWWTDGLLWISPGDGDPDRASRQVREALGQAMPVAAKLLEVRTTASVVGYRLDAEADAGSGRDHHPRTAKHSHQT
jgi:hypothetical protein